MVTIIIKNTKKPQFPAQFLIIVVIIILLPNRHGIFHLKILKKYYYLEISRFLALIIVF